jgi:hypothetical protein
MRGAYATAHLASVRKIQRGIFRPGFLPRRAARDFAQLSGGAKMLVVRNPRAGFANK